MPPIRFRIRTIMITIAAVAVMMGVLRFATPWINGFLDIVPLSRIVPVAVLFGAVVEFLVFWLYFSSHRRRARRIPRKADHPSRRPEPERSEEPMRV
jgi:pilus assembly protein TadC